MSRLLLVITVFLSVFASNAFACGGGDLSEAEIAELSHVQLVQEKISSLYETPIIIESIIKSGNSLLNIDKQAVVNAMCNANYINVYFTTSEASDLICMTTFQINNQRAPDFNGLIPRILCRKDGKIESIKFSESN